MSLKPYKLASLKDKIEAIEEKSADKVEPAEVKKPRKTKKGMNKGNSTLTVIAAIALAFVVALGVTYFGTTPKGDKGDKGDTGIPGLNITGPKGDRGEPGTVDNSVLRNVLTNLVQINEVIKNLPKSKLGATPGPDFYGPYWGVNDLKTYTTMGALTQSTSTPCSIQSPIATSTLVSAGALWQTATGSVLEVEYARSATAFATTTRIGALQRVTGDTAGVTYATSSLDTFPLAPFFTNNWLTMKVSAPEATTNIHNNGTGFRPTGTCWAVFQSLERQR